MTISVINYMKWRHVATLVSAVLVIGSLVSLAVKGLELGLDFTGGTQIEVGFQQEVDIGRVRSQLTDVGFDNPQVVYFGSQQDVLIKFKTDTQEGVEERVVGALSQIDSELVVKRLEFVGPQVGEELRDEGGLGILVAMLMVLLYVSMRFQYKFAVGASAALVHDVVITVGLFSVLGLEFDLTVLAAVLAVVGYSLNDTIIIFDRIRENFRLIRETEPVDIINESLTQVLVRTLYTTGSTLLVLLALFFFGGDMIHNFALALIVGVVVGTLSSIYVAANLLLALNIQRDDLVRPVKEGEEEFDGLP